MRLDGRNVDPELGLLEGEAAGVKAKELDQPYPIDVHPPSSVEPSAAAPTYYGQPTIKEPVWVPAVPAYFFVGGVAGAASLFGALLQAAGRGQVPRLVERCRWIGTAGDLVGAGLLTYDLGRPSRFLNMLRVFRPTSPMSVGAWLLSVSGALNTSALVLDRLGFSRLGNAADYGSGALGLPLAGYTAVLLTNSAVPVWQGARRTLPFLFMGSGIAACGSLLQLMELNPREERLVRRFATLGRWTALAAGLAVEREVSRTPRAALPLRKGFSGALCQLGKVLTAASLGISLVPALRTRGRRVEAALGILGSLATRFGVFQAGKASARDPRATFQQQRLGHGAAEVTGKPARYPLPVVSASLRA